MSNGIPCPAVMDLNSRNICEDCERLRECKEAKMAKSVIKEAFTNSRKTK